MTECFHCGLPAKERFNAEINGKHRAFCCPGCRAVCEFIQNSNLEDFYNYRDELPLKPPLSTNRGSQQDIDFSIYDDKEYQQDFVTAYEKDNSSEYVARLQIYGMNCSACAWLIEKQLEKTEGVCRAQVNYSQHTLHVRWKPESTSLSGVRLSNIVEHIYALGFEFSPYRADLQQEQIHHEERQFIRRIGVAGIGMMQVGMYAMAGYFGATQGTDSFLRFASLLITTLVIFYSAQPFFTGAWRALKRMHLTMDVPVSVALGLAYIASLIASWDVGLNQSSGFSFSSNSETYFDAICMFSFFLLLSRFLEFKARSRWQIQRLTPDHNDYANLIGESGTSTQVASISLKPGQRILVKTGDMFPVDVTLASAQAEISQAQLTGEFSPLIKKTGDEISSGSINLEAPVEGVVLRAINHSTLSRIESMVAQAQLHKPHISSLADQISGYFVTGVLFLSLASYLYWLQIDPAQAFWIALSVLVVSCPCALSLATPTALTVLMRHLHSQGILVQNSSALEKLNQIDHIVFDKTGTLTSGEFQIDWMQDFTGEGKEVHLRRAAVLEQKSNHPLAKAFTEFTPTEFDKALDCSHWRAVPTEGIEASLNGEKVRIGDARFVAELDPDAIKIDELFQSYSNRSLQPSESPQRNGSLQPNESPQPNKSHPQKLLYLASERQLLAVFALSDQIRPEALTLISQLKNVSKGLCLSILSGDNSDQVAQVARNLQITNVHQGLNPAEKLSAINNLQNNGHCVMAVGDGVNDAPLLASADISIAVCNAVDMSKQKADFILTSNDLTAIDGLFKSASKGKAVIVQNLCWALGYNLCAIPLAAMGLVPPWLAALGMSASSAVVVLNAFRAQTGAKKKHKVKHIESKPVPKVVQAANLNKMAI